MQENTSSAILSSIQASGKRRKKKKSLPFPIKINVCRCGAGTGQQAPLRGQCLTVGKLTDPCALGGHKCCTPRAGFTRGTQSPAPNQPLLLLLQVLYQHTPKPAELMVLEGKGESEVALPNPEEDWECVPSRLTFSSFPGLRSPPAAPVGSGRQVSGLRFGGTPQAAPAVQEGQVETQQTFLIYCSARP